MLIQFIFIEPLSVAISLLVCFQVSRWTRLCELEIPCAVEEHLGSPAQYSIPPAVLLLEKRLGEPVKVHNDDKLRRQKLQQQTTSQSALQEDDGSGGAVGSGVELDAAMAKLTTDGTTDADLKKPADIRRVKTTQLPELEHQFAEGLYFTLTDVVLLPCIHQYLVRHVLHFM